MDEKEKNCIFCKIIKKKIPSDIIYEDEDFLGFLDINPVVKGHSLLIPKKHYEWIQDVPDLLLADSFIVSKKIIKKIIITLGCDYVQVVVVGKDVPHFHIHLIPRLLNDNLPEYETVKYKNTDEQLEFALKIKKVLLIK